MGNCFDRAEDLGYYPTPCTTPGCEKTAYEAEGYEAEAKCYFCKFPEKWKRVKEKVKINWEDKTKDNRKKTPRRSSRVKRVAGTKNDLDRALLSPTWTLERAVADRCRYAEELLERSLPFLLVAYWQGYRCDCADLIDCINDHLKEKS